MRTRMHADEIITDEALARRLVARQFPQWAGLPVRYVPSDGTDHDVYRLGDHLTIRLPRLRFAEAQAVKEAEWLPRLAPRLPRGFTSVMGPAAGGARRPGGPPPPPRHGC